jgi:hypothetical protein
MLYCCLKCFSFHSYLEQSVPTEVSRISKTAMVIEVKPQEVTKEELTVEIKPQEVTKEELTVEIKPQP